MFVEKGDEKGYKAKRLHKPPNVTCMDDGICPRKEIGSI